MHHSSKNQYLVGCEGNPQHHQQSNAVCVPHMYDTCVQQEVAALSAASSRYQAQLEGLQTLLVNKVSQCSRLEKELRETSKQLRQVEAAAAADQAAMAQQLQQLSDGAAGLQEALAAGRQREQQLEAQLAATRAKVRTGPQLTAHSCLCWFGGPGLHVVLPHDRPRSCQSDPARCCCLVTVCLSCCAPAGASVGSTGGGCSSPAAAQAG